MGETHKNSRGRGANGGTPRVLGDGRTLRRASSWGRGHQGGLGRAPELGGSPGIRRWGGTTRRTPGRSRKLGSRFWGAGNEALTQECVGVRPGVWRDSKGGHSGESQEVLGPQGSRKDLESLQEFRGGGRPGAQGGLEGFREHLRGPQAFGGSPVFQGICRSWGRPGGLGGPQEFWGCHMILGRRERGAARADGRGPDGAAR